MGVSTIKECSRDDSNEFYLVESEKEVLNFDDVCEFFAKEIGVNKPSSVDSIYFQDNKLCLVEFKNTDYPKPEEIRTKIHDTLAMLRLRGYISDNDYKLIKVISVKKFKGTALKERHHLRNAGLPIKLKSGLDFLQKVYPAIEFFEMNPEDYKESIA